MCASQSREWYKFASSSQFYNGQNLIGRPFSIYLNFRLQPIMVQCLSVMPRRIGPPCDNAYSPLRPVPRTAYRAIPIGSNNDAKQLK